MKYELIMEKLLFGASLLTVVKISGVERKLKGIVKLTSLNYRKELGYYYKVFFDDHSSLIIIPTLEQIQFSKDGNMGAIKGISDSDIGNKEIIEYNNQKYKLENKNDYQYTLNLLCGNFEDVEGECKFSDYVNVNDPDDNLSLGWLMSTGKRADVHIHTINLTDITIY